MQFLSIFVHASRRTAIIACAAMIALIAFIDWRSAADIPLGFLYLFPMLLAGSALRPWQIIAIAAVCTGLTEVFDEFPWSVTTGLPRDILYFAAFSCTALFVFETFRRRELSERYMRQIEGEMRGRMEAEEQLKVLVESSPAAIFTSDPRGHFLLANEAAHRLFGVPPGSLAGVSVREYLPSLLSVPAPEYRGQPFRTSMQCQGHRADGEAFQAEIWFSTYITTAGPRLAAMVLDTSEDLRLREETSLHQLSLGSRILIAAVTHEVRNVCGAIAMVYENLVRGRQLAQNKDFEALGTLVQALERIAAMDLRQTAIQGAAIDLRAVLEEFRIVVDSSLRDDGVITRWHLSENLPLVWAERQSLMQVFLNLVKNSARAMENRPDKQLTIAAQRQREGVVIRFVDTGGGVANPGRLFRPFQPGADATGLGLYLSRAFMRSFRGDLRYEAVSGGAAFLVELSGAVPPGEDKHYGEQHQDLTGGRPQPLSREPEPAATD